MQRKSQPAGVGLRLSADFHVSAVDDNVVGIERAKVLWVSI